VLLLYGFMCVAATAAIWDNLATLLYLPVSTTHTTGARVTMGFMLRLGVTPLCSLPINAI
jgi:phosphate/sulfate permease